MVYDVIIAVLLLLAAWQGWRKGAIRQLIALAVIIAAALLGTAFGTPVGKALGIGQKLLQPILGFFIVFLVLSIIGQFLSRLLHPKAGMSASANNLLGAAFATLRMILIVGLFASFLRMFAFPAPEKVKDTVLYPFVIKTSSLIVSQIRPLVSQLETNDEYEEMGSPGDSTNAPH